MKKRRQTIFYLLFDYVSAIVSWFLFTNLRVMYVEVNEAISGIFIETNVRYVGAIIGIPLLWIALYAIAGYYREVFRKSRLTELGQTFVLSLIGNVVIFFVLILDDHVLSHRAYYSLFFGLFGIHFTLTWLFRFLLTHTTKRRIASGKAGFNTLLIGSNSKALNLYKSLRTNDMEYGYRFVGFVDLDNEPAPVLSEHLPYLGDLENVPKLIREREIEEVIIAIESSEHAEIERILSKLDAPNLIIKVIPALYDVLTGKVRMSFFLGTPLIMLSHATMSPFQSNFKRVFDIVFSLSFLLFSFPLTFFVFLILKFGSKGGVFYTQERIGLHEKLFKIYKFRTMVPDAELHGPQLSSAHDPRITPVGRFLRKTRIDEIPQFINVLKGEMSVVGPRPERRFYIDQILKHAPHYAKLFQVRPGITSWGAVKYGYTENLAQMLEQLNYDIFYVENMSVYLDFKILLYTIGVVLRREGK